MVSNIPFSLPTAKIHKFGSLKGLRSCTELTPTRFILKQKEPEYRQAMGSKKHPAASSQDSYSHTDALCLQIELPIIVHGTLTSKNSMQN